MEKDQQEEGYVPPTKKEEEDRRLRDQTLRFIRKMQKTSGRLLPFLPLARLCDEITYDFKPSYPSHLWSPVAINLVGALLETHLIGLFEDSNAIALSENRIDVQCKDINLALRIRKQAGGRP